MAVTPAIGHCAIRLDGLAERLVFAKKYDNSLSELERIALIERFGDTEYKDAFDWVREQAWRHGYEHQACIALAKIDFERAAPYLNQKIVEASYELNKNAEYPFDHVTLGRILESVYTRYPPRFVQTYGLIKTVVIPEFLRKTLNFIVEPHQKKISELLGIDYKDFSTRSKKRLS